MENAFGKALKIARKAKGLTLKEVGGKLGISYAAVQQWEAGNTFPSTENLLAVSRILGLDIQTLKASMPNEPREIRRVPVGQEFDPDPHEAQMVEGTEGKDVGGLPSDAILVPDLRVGMGGGGLSLLTSLPDGSGNSYAAEGVRDWLRLPDYVVSGRFRVPAHRIRCFEAVSDSMQPTVLDGDMVFVDIGHRMPSPPGIYALADVLGGVILKRLEISSARNRDESDPIEVKILSDNPKHSPEVRTLDEIAIVGRYLGRLTTV